MANMVEFLNRIIENLGVFGTSGFGLDYAEYMRVGVGCEMPDLRGVKGETQLCLISEMQKQNVSVEMLLEVIRDVGPYVRG